MSGQNNKIAKATKWSTITELTAKLITPITSVTLAHLLTPDAFGVVATLTMIITFAEIFTDAGFQRYLIQHEFMDEVDRIQSTNVAFWSNLTMSLLIWMVIVIFSDQLAAMVGSPNMGHVLSIACVSIPIAAFSSIQMAVYKRDLDFKTLFKVRIVGICIPLFVTVPLALLFKSYWALVIGTIFGNIVNAIILTTYSKWIPRLYYSFTKLKEMLSYTLWSVVEAISIWLTNYVDIFIIGIYLNEYYVGLYMTSITIVGQILGLITSATIPILFSSLSRLQNDDKALFSLFFKFQRIVSIFVIPLGVGIYCFRDLFTGLFLGDKWFEASGFIGLWGLTSSITVPLSYYCTEVYRAKGKVNLSVWAQWIHIFILWPTLLFSVRYSFEMLYTSRALVRLSTIVINLAIMYIVFKVSPWKLVKNIYASCLAALLMGIVAYGLSSLVTSTFLCYASIPICIIVYFSAILLFPKERTYLLKILKSQKIKI